MKFRNPDKYLLKIFYAKLVWIVILLFQLNKNEIYAQSTLNYLNHIALDSTTHLNPTVAADTMCLSVWGYVSPTSQEYAIVGTNHGVDFIDVTDPSAPDLVVRKNLPALLASDINVYDHYAYLVGTGATGLQMKIYDLQYLPTAVPATTFTFSTPGLSYALYIDTANAMLYIFGPTSNGLGALIYDLEPNPLMPTLIGHYTTSSLHDGFVINDNILIGMNIVDGVMEYIDISNKALPTLIGNVNTPFGVGYSPWVSTSHPNIVFGIEETAGSHFTAYDISDPTDIQIVNKTNRNTTKWMLNLRVLNDYGYVAYTQHGVSLFDGNVPEILTEVGNYKWGWLSADASCDDVYPYLPSQTVLAIDKNFGLFLLSPTYTRASYLVGIVRDTCGNTLSGVSVKKLEELYDSTTTIFSGGFKNGYMLSGASHIVFSKSGYLPDTLVWDATLGVIDTVYIVLQKSPQPIINPIATDTLCFGSSTTLSTASVGAGYSLQWYKNGVPISSATSTSIAVNTTGVYEVRLIFPDGCYSVSDKKNIYVLGALDATIAGAYSNLCAGVVYTYSVDSIPFYQYQWTVVGGTILTGQGTTTITVLWNAGVSTATVTVEATYP